MATSADPTHKAGPMHDQSPPYRNPHDEPGATAAAAPREELGRADIPVVGEVAGEILLDRPFHLDVDRHAAIVRPAGGLVVRAEGLPTIDLQAVQVDLVDGLVRTEASALGALFDRALTVLLCSALRQTLGWRPGTSATVPLTQRLPQGRRRFPRTSVALSEDTRVSVDLGGEAATVTLSRPGLLRFLGLPLKVSALRYEFASARVTAEAQGIGPIRRGLLRLVAWGATRWLRPKLPSELRRPGYNLFADGQRRAHLMALVAKLRGKPAEGPETMGAGAGRPGHELARAGEGKKAGMFGLFSASKAAIAAALLSLRVTADDVPARTRVLVRLPLGPFSRLALCTDRGGEVVITKYPGGLRLEAPLGIYLFADQFPELAELRLTRVVVDLSRKQQVGLEVQTEPPLGPLGRALLDLAVENKVRPRLPTERLTAAGVWDDGPEHVLFRHDFGNQRSVSLRTRSDAEVRVRHRDDALVIEAPAGLEALFGGLPLPATSVRRIAYRWADGTIAVDGSPEPGELGHSLAAALMRVRVAPRLPPGVGVQAEASTKLEPAQLERFSVSVAAIPVPLLGKLELRMDPQDTVNATLGPALAECRSDLGLLLVARELDLAVEIRSVRYDLAKRAMRIDASPSTGPYVEALAAMCVDSLLVPLLRKALPLGPDVDLAARWTLLERFGVRVSLPPGASVTARRTPHALELGGSVPLEFDGDGGLIADFTAQRVRWLANEDRLVVDSTPACGPLLSGLLRRVLDRVIPDFVARGVSERLGLPAPQRQEVEIAPTMQPLFETEVSTLGPLALYVDTHRGMTLTLRREGASLQFGAGAIVRADRFGAQVVVHGAEATFLPFTVHLDSEPPAGELEDHLLAQVARTLLAPAMRMLWPADRAAHFDGDVLLALGTDSSWGPLELCVPSGGQVSVALDHDSIALRSEAGVFVAGLDWLPRAGVHALRVRFEDGAVDLEVGEIGERFYHEPMRVSPTSTEIAARLLSVYVSPHTPGWAQRLGARILPPPKPLPEEPGRKLVWQSQLPGGLAKLAVRMDPMDVLELRASRVEIAFTSQRGLHLDLENLGLRLPVFRARYHMVSGELQLGELGQLENAVAEGLLRKALAAVDEAAAPADEITVLDILERFPLEDGKRILFGDKVVQVRMDPASVIVLRVGTEGLVLTVDPPVEIDGPAVLNFVFHGLRYDFSEGEFHIDWKHDGVISRLFAGVTRQEGEGLLNSLRPALPAAMRRPGYSLAADPNPAATLGQLIRTVSRRSAQPPRGDDT